jgi:hypothetical protein
LSDSVLLVYRDVKLDPSICLNELNERHLRLPDVINLAILVAPLDNCRVDGFIGLSVVRALNEDCYVDISIWQVQACGKRTESLDGALADCMLDKGREAGLYDAYSDNAFSLKACSYFVGETYSQNSITSLWNLRRESFMSRVRDVIHGATCFPLAFSISRGRSNRISCSSPYSPLPYSPSPDSTKSTTRLYFSLLTRLWAGCSEGDGSKGMFLFISVWRSQMQYKERIYKYGWGD